LYRKGRQKYDNFSNDGGTKIVERNLYYKIKWFYLWASLDCLVKTPSRTNMKRSKIDLEFIFRASPEILYKFLVLPECLVRWFCDGVDITGDQFVFEWDGDEENAELVDDIEAERLRFKWEDSEDGEHLEFRMYKSGVTNETILEITDYCDEGEEDLQSDLWASQISKLRKETGG
jgi:uncharacterized protein YndB with AHSA1/START domain